MADAYTWVEHRAGFDALSDVTEEWQGLPIPVSGLTLRLHDRHPLASTYAALERETDGVEMAIVVGGPSYSEDECVHEEIVNQWFAWKLNVYVQIWKATPKSGPPKFFAIRIPRSPDSSMDRLTFWLQTLGASDAWDEEAEHRARVKLRAMISARQWRHYDLTGSFIETSSRSRVTYVFRRLRPTIALTPRGRHGDDMMRCLAVLCMHPIGYYQDSWAGCMVPSDDLIAHLAFMRGDEAGYWKEANQHEPRAPEAGL